MAWKFESGKPLVTQIEERIRHGIISGVYERGADFPTVRQLAAEASVNPNTMQKALSLLEDEGLLITNGTAGRTVTDNDAVILAAKEASINQFLKKVVDQAVSFGIDQAELSDLIRRYDNDAKQ